MSAVLLTSDLMVASRVEGAAARIDVLLQTVPTVKRVAELCDQVRVQLVLVDLSAPALKPGDLVDRLASVAPGRPTIVAFGPHVHEALLTAAREAGCDEVVSRGQFFAQLDAILQRLDTNLDGSESD